MKFGISPVVATVLLIAITVTASITTWYWLVSYTLKPALTETIYKVFTVVGVYKNSSKNGCNALDIKNAGGTTVSNTLLYVKDYATGKPAGGNGTNPPYQAYVNLSNLEAGKTSVFSINGLGSVGFLETSISDEPILVVTVAIGDANNDGKNEIVIGLYNNSVSNKIRMYENKSGRWVETNISDELNTVYKVVIGDPNNDGRNEVVIALDLIPNETRMYENKSGGWIETNISDEPTAVLYVAVGDANNDGKNEVVVTLASAPSGNEVRMYENKSGGWIGTDVSGDLNDNVKSAAIGDPDNDGANEIVIGIGSTDSKVRMYENTVGIVSLPFGTYTLRTSASGFADQIFTCA